MGIPKITSETLTEEMLFAFIKGRLEPWEADQVQNLIQESKSVFFRYMSLKEALFLEKRGKDFPRTKIDSILKTILPKNKENNHIQVFVKFLNEKVVISSSDQDTAEFQSVMANFAFPKSRSESVTIVRKILGKQVTLVLSPLENRKEFHLTIQLTPFSQLACDIFVEGQKLESVKDLSKNSKFMTALKSNETTELQFVENGEIVFSFGIFLQVG